MDVPVLRSSLVGLMLLHEREQLLGGPALRLEVVIVRRRGTGVHLKTSHQHIESSINETPSYHEVDGRPATQDMGSRYNGTAAIERLRGAGLVECCRLGVQLHISGVDPRTEDPWVVQVALSSFD